MYSKNEKKWLLFGSLLILGGLMYEDIVTTANKYVGEKEIKGNQGFMDPAFQKEMEDAGWHKGDQWCMLFAKFIWKKILPSKFPRHWTIAQKLLTAGSQSTYSNFLNDKSGLFNVSLTPQAGSIVIFQKYVNGVPFKDAVGLHGHAGIVENYTDTTFSTIEGNTSSGKPNDNDGEGVWKHTRSFPCLPNTGLRLKGFINIVS